MFQKEDFVAQADILKERFLQKGYQKEILQQEIGIVSEFKLSQGQIGMNGDFWALILINIGALIRY